MNDHQRSWWTVLGVFLIGVVVVGVLYLIPRDTALTLLEVGGGIASLSTGLYFAGAILLLVLELRTKKKGDYRGAIILFSVAVIQWDPTGWLGSRATDPGHFFDSDVATGKEKIAGLFVVLVLATVLVSFAARNLKTGFLGLTQGNPVSVFLSMGLILIPISLVLDKIQGDLIWQKGYRIRFGAKFAIEVVEETLELLIPAFFLAAILAVYKTKGFRRILSRSNAD